MYKNNHRTKHNNNIRNSSGHYSNTDVSKWLLITAQSNLVRKNPVTPIFSPFQTFFHRIGDQICESNIFQTWKIGFFQLKKPKNIEDVLSGLFMITTKAFSDHILLY